MMPRPLRILLCAQAVDMRASFDRLTELVVDRLDEDPTTEETLFVFINGRRDRAKILWRDSTGFCLLYKRLDTRFFAVPEIPTDVTHITMDASALAILLEGAVEAPPTRPTNRDIARAARALVKKRIAMSQNPQLSS
jgi:transposase